MLDLASGDGVTTALDETNPTPLYLQLQRVIQDTIRETLPAGFQRAEYQYEHGMVDLVVHRHELRATLARICAILLKRPAVEAA